jgi:hypothetical protein
VVRESVETASTLKHGRLYQLYKALSGDDFRGGPLWARYDRHITLRNGIVHRGEHATKAQATEAYDTAEKVIHHFETVLQ